MEANRPSGHEPKTTASVADLLRVSAEAVSFFFELTAENDPLTRDEIQTKYSLFVLQDSHII